MVRRPLPSGRWRSGRSIGVGRRRDVVYVKGALLWAAQVASLTKSSMVKLSRRPEYKLMTVRNLNTTLKLRELVSR